MAITRGVYNISHYRGDAYIMQWTILDLNEDTGVSTPVDITDMVVSMDIRATADSTSVIFTPTLEKTDPTNGIFQWRITPAISDQLQVTTGVYDIQLTVPNVDPTLTQILTIITGSWAVVQDVTRP